MSEQHYDLFLSYAHVDNESDQYVTKLAKRLESFFRSLTGRDLRIFIDTRSITTSQLWEERIRVALQKSTLMVAVLTPSYFTSEWCAREWDYFRELETNRRKRLQLPTYDALIFPIRRISLRSILRPTAAATRRMAEAEARQYVDFEDVPPESPEFDLLVKQLAGDIIETLSALYQKADTADAVMTTTVEPQAFKLSSPGARSTTDHLASTSGHPGLTTYIGYNRTRFVKLLSEATSVTIIGITNLSLPDILEEALRMKRDASSHDAFWTSIRIVYLGEHLLPLVNDELISQSRTREEAVRVRVQKAGQGKRGVISFLLRSGRPYQWQLYDYPFVPPFVGSLFEMSDGGKVAQVAMGRPAYSIAEHLFFEFVDTAGELAYFQAAFEEVVHACTPHNEVVLVGSPMRSNGLDFVCQGARFRRSVLIGDANQGDWLAAIIAMLWWERGGMVSPVLQVNTPRNSTRELGKLSHISGYINQQDSDDFEQGQEGEFVLPLSAAENAFRRELSEELGIQEFQYDWHLVDKLPFYYWDKENLYFYLFELQIPAEPHRFPKSARLAPWSLRDLLSVRKYQVLLSTVAFLRRKDLPQRQREVAARIAALNLDLHNETTLAASLLQTVKLGRDTSQLEAELAQRSREAQVTVLFDGREQTVEGLAGLQYREFFSTLLPAYARIGMTEAQEELRRIDADSVSRSAVSELANLYHDEMAMSMVPIEL